MLDNSVKYILKSSYRVRVLQAIGHDVKTPSQIAKDSSVLNNHISRTLRQLYENDLIELINPEMHCGRLYRLTEKGLVVLSIINNESVQ